MRIIVFSDTHGNYSAMHKIFKRNGDADLFIFLVTVNVTLTA